MRAIAAGMAICGLVATSAFGAPLHPYATLGLPDSIDPYFRLQSEPVKKIQAGPQSIQLEVTPLKTLRARLGGEIQSGGDAAGAAEWLCFTSTVRKVPVIYWFVSNDEMAGGRVSQVAIQKNDIGQPEGCTSAPPALTIVDFGIPTFGASGKAVARYFRNGQVVTAGIANYLNERPAKGPSPDCTRGQSVQYRMSNGVVNTISVSQVTSC